MLGFGQGAFVALTASPTHQLVVVVLCARSCRQQEKFPHIFGLIKAKTILGYLPRGQKLTSACIGRRFSADRTSVEKLLKMVIGGETCVLCRTGKAIVYICKSMI